MPPAAGQRGRGVAVGVIASAAVVFAVAAWKSAGRLNTLWDERVDLDIAAGLVRAPIRGEAKPLDPTQFRLPMYATAAAFAISGRDDLATARAVSVAVGAIGVVLAGGLAWRLFGAETAAWTAVFLALSPYYLAYGRIAMTEGDVFLATTMTGACWAFAAFVERPTSGRWLLTGIALGLAIGAKAYALVLVPVFAVCMSPIGTNGSYRLSAGATNGRSRVLWTTVVCAGIGAVIALVGVQWRSGAGVVAWIIFVAGQLAVVLAARFRDAAALGRARAVVGMVIVAGLTWGALMPEHVTRPEILRGLFGRAARWDDRAPLAMAVDHLRLYSGIVLLKATWPIGVLTLGGLVYGLFRTWNDRRWRLPTLVICAWIAAMCTLPLRQTFYLMGVYPLLLMVTAAAAVGVARRLGQGVAWKTNVFRALLLVAPGCLLAFRSGRAYPDYQLFPDDLVGTTWLGAEARGYRNLIQTNSDGVEDLVRWCLANVPPGRRVVSFLWEDSIIDRVMSEKPRFTLVRRGISQASDAVPPPPSIAGADYILLHINNILGYGDRPPDVPPMDTVARDYRPALKIRRGRSGMEVAWVYERLTTESTQPAHR